MITPLEPWALILGLLLLKSVSAATTYKDRYLSMPAFDHKPHVAVLTDICNEPDDAESLTRFLLYSNEFHVDALIATTSTWQRITTRSDQIYQILDAYSVVSDRLNGHVPKSRQYPSADALRSVVKDGLAGYGMEAARGSLSQGTSLLIDAVDAVSPKETIWVLLWGGANVLAQALLHVKATRSASNLAIFADKIRVYAISDQDNAGPWIRQNFPHMFYIASIHTWNYYGLAAWSGISGEEYYGFDGGPDGGPDTSLVSKEWIKKNIQIGDFGGKAYPDPVFIPEGDTPSFLPLIQNGLNAMDEPTWGGWGGRYGLVDRDIGGARHYADVADGVVGKDGKTYVSSQATIWRWREAYQNDFAARMQWTLDGDFGSAKHAPIAVVSGDATLDSINMQVQPDAIVRLDASESWSPDGDELVFKWWHYREPSATQWTTRFEVPELEPLPLHIEAAMPGSIVEVKLPGAEDGCPHPLEEGVTMKYGDKLYHIILEVTAAGDGGMESYRRILLNVTESLESEVQPKTHDEL